MTGLTKRQSQILALINSFTQSSGHAPSYRELMQVLGLHSTATLHKHIENLKKLGHLKTTARGWRSLKTAKLTKSPPAANSQIPIVGALSKGQRLEFFTKTALIELPEALRKGKASLYGFLIKDKSFITHQLLDGDIIVVEPRQNPHHGETIVAIGKKLGTLIGRYSVSYSDKSLVSHIDDTPLAELEIQGVIVSMLRSYSSSSSDSSRA